MSDRSLLRLLTWLSPAFPIGAFSYSHGLEMAVEEGLVTNAAGLEAYVATVLDLGAGHADTVLLAAAWRADDEAALAEIATLAAALRGTSELALESAAQGSACLSTLRRAWPHARLDRLAALCTEHGIEPALPVALGVAGRAHDVALPDLATAYRHALAASLISAGLRLIPLGQTDGQRVTAAVETVIADGAEAALACSLDDLGTATPMIDLLSMAHETQYTRLFRS